MKRGDHPTAGGEDEEEEESQFSHQSYSIEASFHIKEGENQFSHLFDSTQRVVVEFIGNQEEETTQREEERRKASFHTYFTRLNGFQEEEGVYSF